MAHVLYIKANPKSIEHSRTFQLSEKFIENYKNLHPEDTITTLDLYKEPIHFLTFEDLNEIFGAKSEEKRNHPILKYAYQFAEADKYVVAAPMWNLSFPAVLKAYMDYVSVSGITFQYTANGPAGLCKNKKAVFLTTSGGEYSETKNADLEMGERYLRALFCFFGIENFQTIRAENLDLQGADVNDILAKAKERAKSLADSF
ncbi:FMN-dependent NADH-azoreductase [[Clostridium] polysaccharolyticum]|uniref:FMN dependent NADH:quinone oxidoreductase n=1 Tax=[Clostridium] polysaccharolyticum TaxID=29364 RepID=A0A1I0EHA6_9FIRM|nr:FMN-dependent NADH-azoreductase [[Clostridium] polysaccharolyticum]SET44549.1 FMN-dependent NADH-azoreductase [[Clostridium] polysaccharolyticum]